MSDLKKEITIQTDRKISNTDGKEEDPMKESQLRERALNSELARKQQAITKLEYEKMEAQLMNSRYVKRNEELEELHQLFLGSAESQKGKMNKLPEETLSNTSCKSSKSHQTYQGIQTCIEDTIQGNPLDDEVCSRQPNLKGNCCHLFLII